MKQKLLSLLFMAFVPITMMAYDYAFNYGDNEYPRFVYFNLNTDGTATVTYLDTEYNSYSGDVAIPKYLEISGQRYTVTSIGKSAFRECTELTSVTIPNSVTSIGEYAFFVCPDLTSVTMPNSVTSIGNYAFSQCGLNSISIPGSVKTIGKEAFAYCENLASVSFAEGLKTIGEDAFSDCYKLTSINIPSTVESIGEGAFACVYFDEVPRFLSTITVASNNSVYDSRNNCNAIIETAKDKLICGCKNTVLPETVKIIDSYAFSCCNIQSIFLSDVVNSIGEGAFKSTKLQTVTILNKSISVGDYAFMDVNNCELWTPEDFIDAGDWSESEINEWKGGFFSWKPFHEFYEDCSGTNCIYYRTNITDMTATVTYDETTSDYNSYRGNVVIPKEITYGALTLKVTGIGESAFRECEDLTSVTIPNTVTGIGKHAFEGCSLESITIPSSVKTISDEAFYFSALESINIPEGVETIGESAFSDCPNLTSIFIPSTVTSIGEYAFKAMNEDNANISSISVASNNSVYDSRNNCNAIIETTTNKLIFGCKNTVIPETVENIGSYAFIYSGMNSVVIPNHVNTIEEYAFGRCMNLTSVTIYNSSTNVGSDAFYDVGLEKDCNLYVPPTFDFGNCTISAGKIEWKGGYFILNDLPDIDLGKITITEAGMATYCSPHDLDFSNVSGLKAYIITGYDWQSKKVYAMRVYDVPAGTGLYLVGAEGEYTVPFAISTSYYINMLVGTLESKMIYPTDGEYTNLRLTGSSPSDASFKILSEARNFSAYKAYLQIPTNILNNSTNAVGIIFDDEADGIEVLQQNTEDNNSDWFTLDGRKLNGKPTTKGVYVLKGRKVVVE